MSEYRFIDFLHKKKLKDQEKQVHWQETKENWIQTIELLFNDIKIWLKEAEKERLIQIKEKNITITEEYIGTYAIPMLELQSGSDTIEITPIARIIVGGRGRVDVINGAKRTILIRKFDEDSWFVITDFQDKRFKILLTKKSFFEMLEEFLT